MGQGAQQGPTVPDPPAAPCLSRAAQVCVVFLLEAGCSDAETSSITGQSRRTIEHYAKQVNQRRLNAAAILKWEGADAARASDQKKREKRWRFVQPPPEIGHARALLPDTLGLAVPR